MSAVEQPLPGFDGALIPGPVFFSMTLLGDPGHKGRHRSRIVYPRGGKPFVHIYPDPATEATEKVLAEVARLRMRARPPSERPLCVLVIADRRIPASWSPRDRQAAIEGRLMPTPRPDIDNHAKLLDSLNGIVYRDDAQICDLRAIKRYSASPAYTVEVREFLPPI